MHLREDFVYDYVLGGSDEDGTIFELFDLARSCGSLIGVAEI